MFVCKYRFCFGDEKTWSCIKLVNVQSNVPTCRRHSLNYDKRHDWFDVAIDWQLSPSIPWHVQINRRILRKVWFLHWRSRYFQLVSEIPTSFIFVPVWRKTGFLKFFTDITDLQYGLVYESISPAFLFIKKKRQHLLSFRFQWSHSPIGSFQM